MCPNAPSSTIRSPLAISRSPPGRSTTSAFTLNGRPTKVDVDPATLVAELLRENLALTGTHVGCDTSQCGACVVLLDGIAVKSCTTLAVQAEGCTVLTIEGLAKATRCTRCR